MNLIVLAAVITVASAAQLPSRSYIPQGQSQGAGGFGRPGSHGAGVFGGPAAPSGFGGPQGGFGHQGPQPGGFGGPGGPNGNGNRPQQAQEKNAAVLKQDQAIDESGSYHFGYETENGIRAEEAGNPSEAQGGFSYKGDDGQTYTITYTSGEGGFRPQGEHLPVPPPTPEAILEALQKNAQDEAAGIFDDGLYHPDGQGGSAGKPGQASGQFGNANRPGLNQAGKPGGFGGNHQNGFNPNSGYTY